MATMKARRLSAQHVVPYQPGGYIANVPVTIQIGHGKYVEEILQEYYVEEILQEYDEVLDIPFTDETPEGKKHIALFLFLTREKGLSTKEAIFTIASESVKEEAVSIVSRFTTAISDELHLHVKRNGAITYGKYI